MSTEIDQSSERHFLHDLCNQLAISQGTVQLLLRKTSSTPSTIELPEITKKLTTTLRSLDRMLELINQRREALNVLSGEK